MCFRPVFKTGYGPLKSLIYCAHIIGQLDQVSLTCFFAPYKLDGHLFKHKYESSIIIWASIRLCGKGLEKKMVNYDYQDWTNKSKAAEVVHK